MKIYHEYIRNIKVSTRAGVASFDEQGSAEVEQDIADVLKGLKGFHISESEETENDLSKMSFNMLKEIAEEKGIKVKTNKKSDLIEAIQALEK